MENREIKSPLHKLIEWVDKELKLQGYEHNQIITKVNELLEEEREMVKDAWMNGNAGGWNMETDWEEDAYNYYDNYYKP